MHRFDEDIANHCLEDPLTLGVRVTPNWSINGLPNGGYLMALMANAMVQASAKKTIAIVTTTFISRCDPVEGRVKLEKIAASSQFERVEAHLYQGQKERLRSWGTFVKEDKDCVLSRREAQAPTLAPLAECIPIPQMPGFTLFDHMDVRLEPACAGWMSGRLADKSEHKGWARFKDDRPYDAVALLLVADCFPPPVYASQGLAAWVPTIEMSVNIRKKPASQWLKCIFRTRFITCGLMEEDGQIWDETGELIALSRQIAQYRVAK
jgi:acyl-CoA thioesterase